MFVLSPNHNVQFTRNTHETQSQAQRSGLKCAFSRSENSFSRIVGLGIDRCVRSRCERIISFVSRIELVSISWLAMPNSIEWISYFDFELSSRRCGISQALFVCDINRKCWNPRLSNLNLWVLALNWHKWRDWFVYWDLNCWEGLNWQWN